MSWDEAKKCSLLQLCLSFLSLSMHKVVDEATLSNTFFKKIVQLHLKSCSKIFFLKNSFTSKVELC
jgi:hypothetical protein